MTTCAPELSCKSDEVCVRTGDATRELGNCIAPGRTRFFDRVSSARLTNAAFCCILIGTVEFRHKPVDLR